MTQSGVKKCVGKDIFERMNYLLQLSSIAKPEASALYSHLLINVSQKAVQRMEPEVKRSICKRCHTLMIPGVSAQVRIRKKQLRWKCGKCLATKVFKTNPEYKLWIDHKEAVVETLRY
ncbi:hypothetical protein PPYR_01192 [Photinus pyralis]|uniref:Uncharacterized protein n=1 Tax=Photinus pyralis TaxID=7054 RepID=A0A1Y1L474_PHOPY|nr:hypothetical protein PPYR_01192 [Photinus pyralis]